MTHVIRWLRHWFEMKNVGKTLERFYKHCLGLTRRRVGLSRLPKAPFGRRWASDLSLPAALSIQKGVGRYSYRGIRMLKNPFDVALYQLLLWNVKPRTIIEIGSNTGSSALWFSDLMKTFEIDGEVISVDVTLPTAKIERANVRFLKGDALKLGEVLPNSLLDQIKRPLLVIEDSAHLPETSLAVLNFFDPVLRPGEYIIIEDGNVVDTAVGHKFRGGPAVAISEFLTTAGDRYELDAAMCDYYGYNFTANPNGYLRKIA